VAARWRPAAGPRRGGARLLRAGHANLEGRGPRRGGRGHLAGRLRRLQEGSDGAAPWAAEHQRPDDRGRHGRVRHRPVARSRHGDGAVRHRRGDRGACGRSRPQRDQGPAGHGARGSLGAAGRRQLGDRAGRDPWRWAPSLRVRPGERVPMDGVVSAGSSSINQAPVTGESIPVDKAVGDPVFAGTINETGSFEFEVNALASNSTLARIIHAVEEAQGTRAPTQGFVDRFAASTRRPSSSSRWRWRCSAPGCSAGPGCRRSTRRWCCWSSPAPARW
jgi:hypothetical protein